MTAQTTGQDVLDRVSEAEAACLRSSIGGEAYEEMLADDHDDMVVKAMPWALS